MATVTQVEPKKKFFYGWYVAIAVLITYTCTTSINWVSTMIFPFLQQEMGWTAATLGMFVALRSYIGILWNPTAGIITNILGNRKAIIIGCIISGTGVCLYTLVTPDKPWLMILFWPGVMSFGQFISSTIGVTSVPRKWFVKNSALVQGMMGSFWGFTSAIIFPSMSGLAGAIGWRNAIYMLVPCFVIVAELMAIFIIRNNPEQKGLNPDGVSNEELKRMREAARKVSGSI